MVEKQLWFVGWVGVSSPTLLIGQKYSEQLWLHSFYNFCLAILITSRSLCWLRYSSPLEGTLDPCDFDSVPVHSRRRNHGLSQMNSSYTSCCLFTHQCWSLNQQRTARIIAKTMFMNDICVRTGCIITDTTLNI